MCFFLSTGCVRTACSKLVDKLWQCCSNNLSTGCVRTACSQLVDKLLTACRQLATRFLSSTDLLQVVPTTCYRPAVQQFLDKLWVTTLWQLDRIAALLQLVDQLAASLLQTHLVEKLWDFHVCTHAQISHLVTGLSTSCLCTACQQVVNKFGTSC